MLLSKIARFRASSFFRDAASLSIGTAVAQLINLAFLSVLTRFYTPEDFGVFALFSAVVWICVVVATLQIEHLIVLPKKASDGFALFVGLIGFSVIFCFLLYVFVFFAGKEFLQSLSGQDFGLFLYAIPATVFLIALSQAFRYWSIRKKRYQLIAKGAIVNSAVIGVTSSGVALLSGIQPGYAGLAFGQMLGTAANVAVMSKSLSYRRIFKRCKYALQRLPMCVGRYGSMMASLTVSYLIKTAYARLPIFIVAALKESTILGYFGLVERVIGAPVMLIANAIGDVYRQRAAEDWRLEKRFDQILLKTVRALALIGAPVYVVAILCAPFAFQLMFGAEWREAGVYASILLIGEYFVFVFSPVDKGSVIIEAKRYIFFWHLGRLLGKLLILLGVLHYAFGIYTILWSLVGLRVAFLSLDFIVMMRFAKGRLNT